MSIQFAGATIRDARRKAGLTQEQLSEGICEPTSLSCIERGVSGVSPTTFRLLMERAGVNVEFFPTFINKTDFECSYILKRARFYVDYWFLSEAYYELEKVYEMKCASNLFHYQEWLLLQSKLQLKSGACSYTEVLQTTTEALHISWPDFNINNLNTRYLSINEIELLLCIAETYLFLNKTEYSFILCNYVSTYIAQAPFDLETKNRLLIKHATVLSNFYLAVKDWDHALATANKYRKIAIAEDDDSLIHDLTFMTGLGYYYQGVLEKASHYIKTAFYSAYSLKNCHATLYRDYIIKDLSLDFLNSSLHLPDIPICKFEYKKITDTIFHNGIYDLATSSLYQFGDIIHDLRTSQKITQSKLCQGLCTKATLSKIENNTLIPETIIAETLLQRLGISENCFTFYSNHYETKLHELKERLIKIKNDKPIIIEQYLNEADNILQTFPSPLYEQFFLFEKATYQQKLPEHIDDLWATLHITLPDFQINRILEYRLSWIELSIINNLAAAYARSGDCTTAIHYLYMILDYIKQNGNDVLHWRRFYCVTVSLLVTFLFQIKRYDEVDALFSKIYNPLLAYAIYFISGVFGNYCQVLGRCNKKELIPQYASYAFYNAAIHENTIMTQKFANVILNNYGINGDYPLVDIK